MFHPQLHRSAGTMLLGTALTIAPAFAGPVQFSVDPLVATSPICFSIPGHGTGCLAGAVITATVNSYSSVVGGTQLDVTLGLTGTGTGYFATVPNYSASGTGTSFIANFAPGDTGAFDAELRSMNLTGSAGTLIRESPTLQSLGTVQISGTSPYEISSFFDIFTELSLNGGNTWIPATSSTGVEGVPEPGTATLLAAAGLLLVAARKGRR